MKKCRWLKWLGIVLLAAGCTGLLAACSDDGDEADAADTAAAGETIIIQDDGDDAPAPPVVDDTAEEDAETEGDTNVALVAPQLVAPRNNQVFDPPDGNYVNIRFEWTAVPGAAAYVFELSGLGRRIVSGTSTEQRCGSGTLYRWRVCARDANGVNGPISGFFMFRVTGFQQ